MVAVTDRVQVGGGGKKKQQGYCKYAMFTKLELQYFSSHIITMQMFSVLILEVLSRVLSSA